MNNNSPSRNGSKKKTVLKGLQRLDKTSGLLNRRMDSYDELVFLCIS